MVFVHLRLWVAPHEWCVGVFFVRFFSKKKPDRFDRYQNPKEETH